MLQSEIRSLHKETIQLEKTWKRNAEIENSRIMEHYERENRERKSRQVFTVYAKYIFQKRKS